MGLRTAIGKQAMEYLIHFLGEITILRLPIKAGRRRRRNLMMMLVKQADLHRAVQYQPRAHSINASSPLSLPYV